MYYTQSGTEIEDAEMDNMRRSAKEDTMHYALPQDCRLMDEAVKRAITLGRPFEEQEVFRFIWEQGIDLYPALDDRFQLHQEARWEGKGEKRKLHPRLWVVRAESRESDERAAFLDSLRHGDFADPELEAIIATRRLSVRTSAQVDRESGVLELCDEDGIHGFSAEETVELLELLVQERDTLIALANQD